MIADLLKLGRGGETRCQTKGNPRLCCLGAVDVVVVAVGACLMYV